jgi:hypothetical protein
VGENMKYSATAQESWTGDAHQAHSARGAAHDDCSFMGPHGLIIDDEDNLWMVDTFMHVVDKRSPEGDLLTLGERNVSSGIESVWPFCNQTNALSIR